jgi:hypothetical protein
MRRIPGKTSLVASGALAAVLPLAIALAPPAEAATGPVITHVSCSATSYFFECTVDWSGGTDPSTVQWVAVANSDISGSDTDAAAHYSIGEGNCVPGPSYEVKATVTDAAGLSASAYTGGPCDG